MGQIKCSIGELPSVLQRELDNYGLRVANGVKQVNDDVSKQFLNDTKISAPRGRRGKFARSFRIKKVIETPNAKTNVWHVINRQHSLTHLIIHGHRIVNQFGPQRNRKTGSKMTRANDFITPNLEKLDRNYERGIERVIANER